MSAVRTAIVGLLGGVTGIGQVHGYERYSHQEQAFRALYATGGAVRGWFVQRSGFRRRQLGSGRELLTETWMVTGFMSLVDADQSELEMDGLVDRISASERADPTLGGVARGLPVDGAAGFQLLDAGPVTFAGVLCHRARLSLLTQRFFVGPPGDFAYVDGASGRLVGAVVARLAEAVDADELALEAVEGRLSWDPNDDPHATPAAIVTPAGEQARLDPTSNDLDERVDLRIAVTIVGRASFIPPAEGALAAGGLEALAERVRIALHGWQPDQVEVPFLYAGAQPVDVAAGLFAWRMTFQPSVYIEDQSDA